MEGSFLLEVFATILSFILTMVVLYYFEEIHVMTIDKSYSLFFIDFYRERVNVKGEHNIIVYCSDYTRITKTNPNNIFIDDCREINKRFGFFSYD